VTISGSEVARAHWLFGAIFLAMVLEELGPHLMRSVSGRASFAFPVVFLLAGVSMWGAAVFGNTAIDAVVHSLWGDVLIAAGVLDLQRRRGRLHASWGPLVLPAAIGLCGALFLAHSEGSPSADPTALWHVLMGGVLVASGVGGLVWVRRGGLQWLAAYAAPLAAFSFLLLTFPRTG
jgi:hypothetical protein